MNTSPSSFSPIPTELILNKTLLFWQYPVITEQSFFNQNYNDPYYFGMPWATIIDKRINISEVFKLLIQYVNGEYYTCCQHISFRKLIPLFKLLKIKILYTPHKIKDEDEINGIKIMPCPLYAVNIEDNKRNKEFKDIDFFNVNRKYLYSFMGGFQRGYLTNIRNDIFNMEHHESSIIINTGDWHFNTTVYSNKQNVENDLNIDVNHIKKTSKYNNILLNSKFSLCPSGSGPNSIRFWESLASGSIPILLADTLDLPYNIEWEKAILIIPEKNYHKIPYILKNISEEEEKERRKNCIEIYHKLRNNFKNKINNNIINGKKTIFTSYLCEIDDYLIQKILRSWRVLNPELNILYFSDNDVKNFFNKTKYNETYKKMKNGVAIADFFRICYINECGGYWFDIDLEPFKVKIPEEGNIHLFDCGYNNISYMFIGGNPNQLLFEEIISEVIKNIEKNIPQKKQHIMEITGPRIIQNIICNKLNIKNYDGCLSAGDKSKTILKDTDYEFIYSKINLTITKTNDYKILQQKYKKNNYQYYNYV